MLRVEVRSLSQENYWYVDLHVHTNVSHDGIGTPEQMIDAALSQNLDAIAITDHNSITANQIAFDYVQENNIPLTIIPGVEVSSEHGHILAIGISKPIEKGLSPKETVKQIHRQKGIAIPSHPFDSLRSGCGKHIETIVDEIDAVETLNGGSVVPWANRKAESWALKNQIPMIGGSDAHIPDVVGCALTKIKILEPSTPLSQNTILNQIKAGNTIPIGRTTSLNEKLKKEWKRITQRF